MPGKKSSMADIRAQSEQAKRNRRGLLQLARVQDYDTAKKADAFFASRSAGYRKQEEENAANALGGSKKGKKKAPHVPLFGGWRR